MAGQFLAQSSVNVFLWRNSGKRKSCLGQFFLQVFRIFRVIGSQLRVVVGVVVTSVFAFIVVNTGQAAGADEIGRVQYQTFVVLELHGIHLMAPAVVAPVGVESEIREIER